MSTRKYSQYYEPGKALHRNGMLANGDSDGRLANYAVADYAETRRNIAAYPINTNSSVVLTQSHDDQWTEWFCVPIARRVITPGTLKILIRGKTNVDGTGSNKLYVKAVYRGKECEITGWGTSTQWLSADITLDSQPPRGMTFSDDRIFFYLKTDGNIVFQPDAVCAYQPADTNAPEMVDYWTSGKLGTDDWPDSAFANRKLRDAIVSVRGQRTMKANVFNHWFKLMTSSSGVDGDLGRYIFEKRAGVSKILVQCCACTGGAAHNIKIVISGTTYSDSSTTHSVSGTTPAWSGVSFSFTSTDITNSMQIEIKFSADDPSVCLPGIAVQEAHLSSTSITHTVPDVDDVQAGDFVESAHHAEIADTMEHLWRRGGMAILLQDWRFTHGLSPAWDALYCSTASADKTDYGTPSSVIARAIAFPSTNVKHINVSLGFEVVGSNGYTKAIEMQLSTSTTTSSYDERGPEPSGDPMYFEHNYGNSRAGVRWKIAPPSAWEETPDDVLDVLVSGPHVGTVWVFGYTDNSGEYIKPKYIAIEEETLGETEFP